GFGVQVSLSHRILRHVTRIDCVCENPPQASQIELDAARPRMPPGRWMDVRVPLFEECGNRMRRDELQRTRAEKPTETLCRSRVAAQSVGANLRGDPLKEFLLKIGPVDFPNPAGAQKI